MQRSNLALLPRNEINVGHEAVNLRRARENLPSSALRTLDVLGLDRSTMLAEASGDDEWDRRTS